MQAGMREIPVCVRAYKRECIQETANPYKHVSVPTGVHVCEAGSERCSCIGAYKHVSANKHKRLQVRAQAFEPSSTNTSASV